LKPFVASIIATIAMTHAATAGAKCSIAKHADIAITMNGLRPIVPLQINGQPARFILDSGAFFSMMSPATAAQFKLKTTNTAFGMRVAGVGGSSTTEATVVKELKFANGAVRDVEFGVAGSEVGADGLLGQNLLQSFDVEYDFGHGAVRLFRTEHCEDARLSYWLPADQEPSTVTLVPADEGNPRTVGYAFINGQKIKVEFDSGAYRSILTTEAAARAGVTPKSVGVVEGGETWGIGRSMVKTYVATFASFAIGDREEIKNAKLLIAAMDLNGVDMLLGADFFISHRIFAATKERKIFLSYSGGPIFNLSQSSVKEAAAPTPDSQAAAAAAEDDAVQAARKGSALVARREFVPGVALLSRAVELSPNDPEFYFQRGNAYVASGQAIPAQADFDRAIELKADFLPALMARAQILTTKDDGAAAISDLNRADRLAPTPADLRYTLGSLFSDLDHFPEAIRQYTVWMDNHPNDSRMGWAFLGRCFARVMANQDLPGAASDCNAAMRRADKHNPAYVSALIGRAAVRLRSSDYGKAIEDCSEALRLDPKKASALYFRGLAEAHSGNSDGGDKDIAASKEFDAKVAARYAKFGFTP
jgi:tetratricopeptide (TPR) repeat protein